MTHPFEAALNEIEAGLEGVTEGPWVPNGSAIMFDHRYQSCCGRGYYECCGEPDIAGECDFLPLTDADAAHIARLDPATVREMIRLARLGIEAEARAAALEAENARMREALLQCAHWFQAYAAGHSNKGDAEKAQRNQDRADYARAALGDSHE